MVSLRVLGAAVIDVGLVAGLEVLCDLLAGDEVTAMTADDQPAGTGQVVCPVNLRAEKLLHAVPCRSIHEQFVFADIPLPVELNLSEIGSVVKDVVNRTAGELGHRRAECPAFVVQPLDDSINRERLVNEKLEDSSHFVGGRWIELDG